MLYKICSSVVLFLVDVGLVLFNYKISEALPLILLLFIPMLLIWFPAEINDLTFRTFTEGG